MERVIWGNSGQGKVILNKGEERTIKGHAWDELPTTVLAVAP